MAEPRVLIEMLTGQYRGSTLRKPKGEAENLVMTGQASWANEPETATARPRETPEKPAGPSTEDLKSLTKDELVSLAEARGVEVVRADGEDGAPLKADYVRALGG